MVETCATTDAQPRSTNGHPHQSTTGVARTNRIHPVTVTDNCGPSPGSCFNNMSRSKGTVGRPARKSRRCMSACLPVSIRRSLPPVPKPCRIWGRCRDLPGALPDPWDRCTRAGPGFSEWRGQRPEQQPSPPIWSKPGFGAITGRDLPRSGSGTLDSRSSTLRPGYPVLCAFAASLSF